MSTPDPGDAPVTIFLLNGTGVSGDQHGPGVVSVPPDEAAALVHECLAVYGSTPPSGWLGNGTTISPYTGRSPHELALP
jgi:hypothetical protein